MNPLLVKLFRVGLVVVFSVFTYLLLSKPTGNVHGLINDKLAHGLGFFVLAFMLEGAFPKAKVIWKVLVLCAYGLLIEVVQLYLGYRHFSWLDWIADIVGVLLFIPFIKPMHQMSDRLFPEKSDSYS